MHSRSFTLVVSALMVLHLCGCQTAHFYVQAIQGTADMKAREKPSDQVIADPSTPEKVRKKLELARQLVDFAGSDLHLPAKDQYTKYADLGRPYVVWNVFAAPEFSLEAKTWWYPVLGRLAYRGYYAEADANAIAAGLRKEGDDVFVGGIEVYSSLGFFHDPLLNTFIQHSEPVLAENLFHELGHQRLFIPGDTDFNEAYATTVGQTGTRRWLRHKGELALLSRYERHLQRQMQVVALFHQARERLAALYGDQRQKDGSFKASPHPPGMPVEEMRRRKKALMDDMVAQYNKLAVVWGVDTPRRHRFEEELDNARLNSMATYYDLVPAFERLLEKNHGDLEAFFKAVERIGKLPKEERRKVLWGSRS